MIRARQLLRLAALPPPRARSYADAAAGPAAMAFTFASPTQVRAVRLVGRHRAAPLPPAWPHRGLSAPFSQPGVPLFPSDPNPSVTP